MTKFTSSADGWLNKYVHCASKTRIGIPIMNSSAMNAVEYRAIEMLMKSQSVMICRRLESRFIIMNLSIIIIIVLLSFSLFAKTCTAFKMILDVRHFHKTLLFAFYVKFFLRRNTSFQCARFCQDYYSYYSFLRSYTDTIRLLYCRYIHA